MSDYSLNKLDSELKKKMKIGGRELVAELRKAVPF